MCHCSILLCHVKATDVSAFAGRVGGVISLPARNMPNPMQNAAERVRHAQVRLRRVTDIIYCSHPETR